MESEEILQEVFDRSERAFKTRKFSYYEIASFIDSFYALLQENLRLEWARGESTLVQEARKDGYDEGFKACELDMQNRIFLDGYIAGLKRTGLCPRCLKRGIQSIHHLIPRSKGGTSDPGNLVALCKKCHDEVEIATDELLKERAYSSQELEILLIDCNIGETEEGVT